MVDKWGNTLNIGDIVRLVNPNRTYHKRYMMEGIVTELNYDDEHINEDLVSVEYPDDLHTSNWFPNSVEIVKKNIQNYLPDELFEL